MLILTFKWLIAQRLFKSFGIKGLTDQLEEGSWSRTEIIPLLPTGRKIPINISEVFGILSGVSRYVCTYSTISYRTPTNVQQNLT
jgi:hypothetical protein